jgi:hypothetical protein
LTRDGFVAEGNKETHDDKLKLNPIIRTPAAVKISGGSAASWFCHASKSFWLLFVSDCKILRNKRP